MRRPIACMLATLVLLAGPATAGGKPDHEIIFTEQTAQFDGEGTLAEGDTKAFRFVVAQPNVTRIHFVLDWAETGDSFRVSRMDTFALIVQPPESSAIRVPVERSDSGQVIVRVQDINPVPAPMSVSDRELASALEAAWGDEGKGEWRALVRLEDTGNPDGATFDEGNDFTLTVHLHHYEAVPMRVVTLSKPTSPLLSPEESTWGLAAGGLAALALGLGVVLAVQRRRRVVSPDGETARRPEQ